MRVRLAGITCLLVLSVLLAGCGGGGSSFAVFDDNGNNPSGRADWTILVFLNADNDLERYGVLNFNQMEQIGSNSRVNIVVQMDRSPGFDSTNENWTGTRRYLVRKDNDTINMTSPVVEDLGEIDMGDPAVLQDFIRWGQTKYPANHYCVVLWNHGSGWRSYSNIQNTVPRNISFDDTSNTSIATTDLPSALSAASPRIDVIAMDASLMQMLEVAYELKDSAAYLVGSEESPPGEGYPYDAWVGALARNPKMSPADLSKTIVHEYVQAYVNSYAVTESAIDLSKIDLVAEAADELAAALIPLAGTHANAIASARNTSQDYAYTYYKDLVDFSGRVSSLLANPAVSAANTKLQAAMSAAVIAEEHTGSSVAQSHGISIYISEPIAYLPRYTELAFARDTRWDELLEALQQ